MVSFGAWLVPLVYLGTLVSSHSIPGVGSIQTQLKARNANPIDSVYNDLPHQDIDFINYHLKNLTKYNSTKCNQCKNKIRYGRKLIDEYPKQQHLVSLLLFKYCIDQNKGKESKCDNVDFFVTTKTKDTPAFNDGLQEGISSATSIDFFDGDFLHVLKNFNVSNEQDLEYYCYYKDKGSCDLPPLVDVSKEFGVDKWWPEKQPKHHFEPVYNKTNREKFNVLHITDFHIQLRYTLGSESNCSQGLCCMPESYNSDLSKHDYNFTSYYKKLDPSLHEYNLSFYPEAHYNQHDEYVSGDYYDFPKYRGFNFNSAPATTFGAYICDSPEVLMNNSLKVISKYHDEKNFEFTIFTGDLVDHDVIHDDANQTFYAESRSFALFKHFLKDISILPSLGNHDTFPYGQVAPLNHTFNSSYNYNNDLIADLVVENGWLPEANRKQMKTHYSGFSYVNNRGLKVISLNSNCYYQKNLWSYPGASTNPDIFGQWKFLVDELVESEKIGQRVWIMAHIPIADYDALPIQAQIFGKIVERFSPYTIANIFYGHTHRDQFHILYSSNSSKVADNVVNMAWVAQSITPLTNNNPSWRYYEVEDQSFNIMDSLNYYTRLNETFTNGGLEPEWDFEYSARKTYDPNNTWPSTAPINATFWHTYVTSKLADNTNIAFHQLYSELQYRHSPSVPNCKNGTKVSTRCWNENYCNAANFLSYDFVSCEI